MTLKERQDIAAVRFEACLEVMEKKGKDYAGEQDSLANFKQVAAMLGLTKFHVWSVYFLKHAMSVTNSILANPENPQVESEPLEDRITDIINYAVLFEVLLKEEK